MFAIKESRRDFVARRRAEQLTYSVTLRPVEGDAPCFVFHCDRKGDVKDGRQRQQFDALMATGRYTATVKRHRRRFKQAGSVTCNACEATVILDDGWQNSCTRCGAIYDGHGYRLAPRSQIAMGYKEEK